MVKSNSRDRRRRERRLAEAGSLGFAAGGASGFIDVT